MYGCVYVRLMGGGAQEGRGLSGLEVWRSPRVLEVQGFFTWTSSNKISPGVWVVKSDARVYCCARRKNL